MAENESIENILLKESRKLKEFQHQVVNIIQEFKNDYKQEKEINGILESKIKELNQSIGNLSQEVKLEEYNKFMITSDIFKLRQLSDQIIDSCDDIKKILGMCDEYQQKCKYNLEKCKNDLNKLKQVSKDILKSQNDVIIDVDENMKKYAKILLENEVQWQEELDNLKGIHKESENELVVLLDTNRCLLDDNSKFGNEIKDIEKQKNEISNTLIEKVKSYEAIIAVLDDNKLKTKNKIEILNENINAIQKKFEGTKLCSQECKKMIVVQESVNENVFRDNIKLEYESKSFQKNLINLEEVLKKDEDEYMLNYITIKDEIELLNKNLISKEEILSKEQQLEDSKMNDLQLLNTDLEGQTVKNKNLETALGHLNIQKLQLEALIKEKNDVAETLSAEISKNSEHVGNLEQILQEIETKVSNFNVEHKRNIENIKGKIENFQTTLCIKEKELEFTKLKHAEDMETNQMEVEAIFNEENIRLEKEIEEIKNEIEKNIEEEKQLQINLETKTLECDILTRKIKTAEDVENSLKKELEAKPVLNKFVFQKKRYFDETSDSSFDGTIPFRQRMLMKKQKLKKAKISLTKNN